MSASAYFIRVVVDLVADVGFFFAFTVGRVTASVEHGFDSPFSATFSRASHGNFSESYSREFVVVRPTWSKVPCNSFYATSTVTDHAWFSFVVDWLTEGVFYLVVVADIAVCVAFISFRCATSVSVVPFTLALEGTDFASVSECALSDLALTVGALSGPGISMRVGEGSGVTEEVIAFADIRGVVIVFASVVWAAVAFWDSAFDNSGDLAGKASTSGDVPWKTRYSVAGTDLFRTASATDWGWYGDKVGDEIVLAAKVVIDGTAVFWFVFATADSFMATSVRVGSLDPGSATFSTAGNSGFGESWGFMIFRSAFVEDIPDDSNNATVACTRSAF